MILRPLAFLLLAGNLLVAAPEDRRPPALARYAALPLHFEPEDARFTARADGYRVSLASGDAVFSFARDAAPVSMQFLGANPRAQVSGADPLPSVTNYLIGSDPSRWRTGVPNFRRVRCEGIYPGIDLVYYGDQRRLEYDLFIAPGADPRRIRIRFQGARSLDADSAGSLVLKTTEGELRLRKPVVYQSQGAEMREIACRYRVDPAGTVMIETAAYDPRRLLVIDPVLTYATYLGGANDESAMAIALDRQGSAYIAGWTNGSVFPTTPGALDTTAHGGRCGTGSPTHPYPYPCTDIFITKLSPSGDSLVYSTYLGGAGDDLPSGIAVDDAGSAYVVGSSAAPDFPLVNPISTTGGSFAAKLSPDGARLIYSTRLGAASASAVALDSQGSAYIAGAVDPTAFAATARLGSKQLYAVLYKTTDGGKTWAAASSGLDPSMFIWSVKIDPVTPSRLFLVSPDKGLFRSTDGGNTWQPSGSGLPVENVSTIRIDPLNPLICYVNVRQPAGGGPFKSIDGGLTWRPAGAGLNDIVETIVLDPQTPSTLFAVTFQSGLFKSTDAAATWQPTGLAGRTDPTGRIEAIALDPARPSTVYAATDGGLLKSSDGGATWTLISPQLAVNFPDWRNVGALVVDPFQPATLYSAGGGIYKSVDGGVTWKPMDNAPGSGILPDPIHPGTLYSGQSVSTDRGETWKPLLGLPFTSAIAAVVPGTETFYAAALVVSVEDSVVLKLAPSGSALVYSTLLGGSAQDEAHGIAVDAAGRAFVTGWTESPDFPVANAIQAGKSIQRDAFVAVLDATGAGIVYSTYLGGDRDDEGDAIAIDAAGAAYVTGSVGSTDFPIANAIQAKLAGDPKILTTDVFVAKIAPGGSSLVYSTYLGGHLYDVGSAIAVDVAGRAHVLCQTNSADFPLANALPVPLRTGVDRDTVVAKLGPGGNTLQYATPIGSELGGLALDAEGNAWVAGGGYRTDLAVVHPLQASPGGGLDAVVARIADPANAVPRIEAVLNGASFLAGPVAPGAVFSLFGANLASGTGQAGAGTLPRALLDTVVLINDLAVPLYFVSPGQINAQVPFEIGPGAASLMVRRGDLSSERQPLSIAAGAPGIFTTNMQGTGAGAILRASDYRLVNPELPVRPGDYVAVFCTGLGAVPEPISSGEPAPSRPVAAANRASARIAGRPAPVSYAGLAPGFVGLYQVNIQVPPDAPAGMQALDLEVAGAASNSVGIRIE